MPNYEFHLSKRDGSSNLLLFRMLDGDDRAFEMAKKMSTAAEPPEQWHMEIRRDERRIYAGIPRGWALHSSDSRIDALQERIAKRTPVQAK